MSLLIFFACLVSFLLNCRYIILCTVGHCTLSNIFPFQKLKTIYIYLQIIFHPNMQKSHFIILLIHFMLQGDRSNLRSLSLKGQITWHFFRQAANVFATGYIIQICSVKLHISSGHYARRLQILSEHLETIKSACCMHKFAYEIKEVLNPSIS